MNRIPLAGKTVGRWTVLTDLPLPSDQKQPRCFCRCSCGTERNVFAVSLRKGISLSCGCAKRESGENHSSHPLHLVWYNMMERCHNPRARSYSIYGGRGIKVHDSWHDWPTFRDELTKEIGPKPGRFHTLDRIRVDENYQPGNVRWATRKEQSMNRRNTRWVKWKGTSRKLVELAMEHHLLVNQVDSRLKSGWSLEKALTTPLGSNGRSRRVSMNDPAFQ